MGKDRQRTLDLGSYRAALRRNHGSFPDFKVLKFQSLDGSDREVSSSETGASNNESTEMSEQQDGLIDLRREYFESVIHTMQTLVNASTSLRSVEIEERPHSLQKILEDLNLFLLSSKRTPTFLQPMRFKASASHYFVRLLPLEENPYPVLTVLFDVHVCKE